MPLLGTSAVPARGEGDTCDTALPLNGLLPISVTGHTEGLNDDYNENCPFVGTGGRDVVYRYTPTVAVRVNITLCTGATAFDTKLYVYDQCPPGPRIACNDDACTGSSGQPFVSALPNVPLQANRTYYIVVDGYDASQFGFYQLDLTEVPPFQPCPPSTSFGQPPHDPNDAWSFRTSEVAAGYIRYEKFWNVSAPLSDVHWWGAFLFNSGSGWQVCDENQPEFEIKFYPDDGTGKPDTAHPDPNCQYSQSATVTPTGQYYGTWPLSYYSVTLSSCCTMSAGWISIQGVGQSNCWFLWMTSWAGDGVSCLNSGSGLVCGATNQSDFDLSLCLTASQTGPCCRDDGTCDIVPQAECQPPPFCRGDCNCDGTVNFADINPFVAALGSGTPCKLENCDVNGDGVINFADINPFVNVLATQSGACPGPRWLGPGHTCDECTSRVVSTGVNQSVEKGDWLRAQPVRRPQERVPARCLSPFSTDSEGG